MKGFFKEEKKKDASNKLAPWLSVETDRGESGEREALERTGEERQGLDI